MRALAVIALVLWMVTSFATGYWQHGVNYPKRPLALEAMVMLTGAAFFALGVWVITRG